MGLRGPAPQSTRLRILSGNPGRRRLNRGEPRQIGPPVKPDFLTGSSAEEWSRVIASMPPGFFTAADTPPLAVLCVALALHREASDGISRAGLTGKGAEGQLVANPMLAVVARQAEIILRATDRLGLNPAARSRLTMPAPPERGRFDGLFGPEGSPAA